MTNQAQGERLKPFLVKAEIRYHEEVGTFYAASEREAIELAQSSDRYGRLAERSLGGVYDLSALEKTP